MPRTLDAPHPSTPLPGDCTLPGLDATHLTPAPHLHAPTTTDHDHDEDTTR